MKYIIMLALFSVPSVSSAFDAREMESVVETSCEINLFSRLRLEDGYKHVFPPRWSDKYFVKREVKKCVKEFFANESSN